MITGHPGISRYRLAGTYWRAAVMAESTRDRAAWFDAGRRQIVGRCSHDGLDFSAEAMRKARLSLATNDLMDVAALATAHADALVEGIEGALMAHHGLLFSQRRPKAINQEFRL